MISEFKEMIKYEIKDDILYFSANGLYKAATEGKNEYRSMNGTVLETYKSILSKLEDGEVLKGKKYNFVYALTYENALEFVDKVAVDKALKSIIKSYIEAVNEETRVELSKTAEELRKEYRELKRKNALLRGKLSKIKDLVSDPSVSIHLNSGENKA